MKIAVVGGGSTYTPELVEGFATRADRLPVDELVSSTRTRERLAIVAGLARRILARRGLAGRLVETGDRAAALDGADFVVLQLRVGGQAARLLDETIPPRFGCIGQETTGPGGFAKALRTVPVVLEIAEETARRGAPGAWLVDFTNPVGIVTQALLDAGHRALGLCNVAIGFQRRFAAHFGVAPERVALEHVGLNHLTWERAIRVDGVDRLPELLADEGALLAEEVGLPLELLRALGALPSYYLHYYYATREVVEEQRTGPTRAEEVMEIERGLLELYRDPSLDVEAGAPRAARRRLLQRGGGPAHRLAPRRDRRRAGRRRPERRRAARPAGRGGRGDPGPDRPGRGASRSRSRRSPPRCAASSSTRKAYEELTVEAALSGDRRVALRALLANPLVPDFPTARDLLEALLEANRAHLPRFFPR